MSRSAVFDAAAQGAQLSIGARLRRRMRRHANQAYIASIRCAAKVSKNRSQLVDDVAAFQSDLTLTRKLRGDVRNLTVEESPKYIDAIDIGAFKTSDTLFVLGSGNSINSLTAADWNHVAEHDSVGFNFWLIHEFTPTYYFLEPPPEDQHECFIRHLERRKEQYRRVPLVCDYKHWNWSGRGFEQFPKVLLPNLYLHVPYYFRSRSKRLIKWWLLAWKLGLLESSCPLERIIHHRATVSAVTGFGILAGYRKIVLLGVDLAASCYFWEEEASGYSDLPRTAEVNRGRLHSTVDPNLTASERAIPIQEFLDVLEVKVMRHRRIRLYVGSRKSLLYPRFPLYDDLPSLKATSHGGNRLGTA